MALRIPALTLCATLLLSQQSKAQQHTDTTQTTVPHQLKQNVHGRVLDAASQQPLPGTVVVLVSDNTINTTTDAQGYFTLRGVPLGRQSFLFLYTGFEKYTAFEVPVITGKQPELNVSLNESLEELGEVTIVAEKDKIKPMNEFATVSARSFSVEETRRYAASIADPARMVMNFPGVSNSGDMDNSIVVRGNSPKGVLWRLEGIEIPNPNHLSGLGASGGAISMLNANTLGNCDFYTGAFAPEIGNALSGAFDINFRNGNTERYEHTVQVGTMGVEVATEGPFQKGKKASYLLNYRYSTLALLEKFITIGSGAMPNYQDMAFKVNLPAGKAGTFSLFGLGGYNRILQQAEADSSKWDEVNNNISFNSNTRMGVAGIAHQYFLGPNAYIKTVLSGSHMRSLQEADTLNPGDGYRRNPIEHTAFINNAYRASVFFNQKLNARHTFRTGVIAQQLSYDFNSRYYNGSEQQWKNIISSDGNTQFYQAYLQWKARLTDKLTLVGGAHGSYLALNGKYSIEPRASLGYQLKSSRITLAAGMHSKPEHISTYMFQNTAQGTPNSTPNKNLDLLRAFHGVAGYDVTVLKKLRVKAEAYYQHLYNIPVEQDPASGFSIMNAENIYSLLELNKPLVSRGTGDNYGVDVSLERPFSNGYYLLASGSLFSATYTTYSGERYNSRYNRGHQLNLIGGKEFKLNAKGRSILGLNGKLLYSGGLRESPIDGAASVQQRRQVLVAGRYFTSRGPDYFRADISAYYKMNRKSATHTLQLDIQNVTNRQNYFLSYFDSGSGTIKTVNQLGIIPTISYRIDFHW
ncbi:MAG: carboxypeptidase-like regulatory domain-containing protein [Flavipsychrobacter sp.]|nr:carboxypeptidase-like regulatory domain-containing protein [Flavipsychrobacter sp.]